MRNFTIGRLTDTADRALRWYVEIDDMPRQRYSSRWAAIVAGFVAAHEATLAGEEAAIALHATSSQVWRFSLMPERDDRNRESARMSRLARAVGARLVEPVE